jgi:putative FmdB family regulatory protein
MTEYEYRCPACGPFTVRRSMGSATPSATCPACGRAGLRRVQATLAGALERQEASADHPEVVRKVPPRTGRRKAPADPRQAALPRR